MIRDRAKCFGSNLIPDILRSTSGVILRRAFENVPCCLRYSILTSEDGTSDRWPMVKKDDSHPCMGGMKKTFQQWVDAVVTDNDLIGLCFDGWLYGHNVKGKSKFNNPENKNR